MPVLLPTPGGVWSRGRAGLGHTPTVPRNKRPDNIDRWGRDRTKRNPEGKLYEPCPMCRKVATVRTIIRDADGQSVLDTTWLCDNCGYHESDKFGPLN